MSTNKDDLFIGPSDPKLRHLTQRQLEAGTDSFKNFAESELKSLNKIAKLEREITRLKKLVGAKTRKYKDVIYRLEAEADLRWCEDCDTIVSLGEPCHCAEEDDPCLTDSERNR